MAERTSPEAPDKRPSVTNATLNLGDVTVPNKVIYGIEIRTSDYGDPAIGGPLGDATACHATSQGCPYDSLNVALSLDPDNVTVGSNALTNGIYWNTALVADGAALFELMKKVAVLEPQPEVHIRGDQDGRYEYIGKIVVALQQESIYKVAFITEPPPHGG